MDIYTPRRLEFDSVHSDNTKVTDTRYIVSFCDNYYTPLLRKGLSHLLVNKKKDSPLKNNILLLSGTTSIPHKNYTCTKHSIKMTTKNLVSDFISHISTVTYLSRKIKQHLPY
jgi:hypothetical protein